VVAVAKKRRLGRMREAAPCHEIDIHFAGGVRRERHDPGLVELGGADRECPLAWVVVAQGEADELTTAQPRRVEQDDGQAEDRAVKR
jgi:hypothetical protein